MKRIGYGMAKQAAHPSATRPPQCYDWTGARTIIGLDGILRKLGIIVPYTDRVNQWLHFGLSPLQIAKRINKQNDERKPRCQNI